MQGTRRTSRLTKPKAGIMTLSASDMFAIMLVLATSNLVLVLAMRRVYILEKRLAKLRGY